MGIQVRELGVEVLARQAAQPSCHEGSRVQEWSVAQCRLLEVGTGEREQGLAGIPVQGRARTRDWERAGVRW